MASLTKISGVLGRKHASHLLRRATFGPTISQIDQFAGYSADEAMNLLLDDTAENPLPPVDTVTGQTWVDPTGISGPERAGSGNSEQDVLFGYFQSWHMDVMRQAPLTLKERITWFLHTHLPARWTEINSSEAIYYQNCLFRHYAYGSFKELFKKICVDNAMLRYLDGYSNKKNSPNENFAREMFELYSIGKGPQLKEGDYTNYSEDDIRAATKVLTGWMLDETFTNLDPDTGLPAGKMDSHPEDPAVDVATEHDPGQKIFTSKFGTAVIEPAEFANDYPTVEAAYGELDAMIEMIFAQKETGRFIARKLYRFFVYHFISEEVEQDIIEPLAQVLIDQDYNLVELLKILLKSEHFYDRDDAVTHNDSKGALIKSPVDMFTGLFRMFEIDFADRNSDTLEFYNDMSFVVSKLEDQGLNFYEPFEVAGYPAYHQVPGFNRNWITTYALAHRYQLGGVLMKTFDDGADRGFWLDVVEWVENSGTLTDPTDATELLDLLVQNLYAVEITIERYNYFLYTVFLDLPDEDQTYARGQWKIEWNAYKNSGDDTTVRLLLERLLSGLIETPEFQLY